MKKVATFVRVSEHSNAANAASEQKKQVVDYCKDRGYEVTEQAEVIGDRQSAFPLLKKLLDEAKEKGYETIVMQSTNRVVGTVNEIEPVAKAFKESGVTLETVDGSHKAMVEPSMLIQSMLDKAVADEPFSEDGDELIFGYDRTEDGLVVNEAEAEVVRYCFKRQGDYWKLNHDLTQAEITQIIEAEVKKKWPEQYESLVAKTQHNAKLHEQRFAEGTKPTGSTATKIEPIISREKWDEVQARLAESQEEQPEQNEDGEGFIQTM